MFDNWDAVRVRLWHPMITTEQSMKELDRMNDLMLQFSNSHNGVFSSDIDDDKFFEGSPAQGREQSLKRLTNDENDENGDKKSKKVSQKSTAKKNLGSKSDKVADKNDRDDRQAFSTYSFSNSTVVDGKGGRVTSIRRRYEDSSGRLKAVHERRVEGKKLRTTWSRDSKEDKERLESVCSSGTPDEFEAMWLKTPFGRTVKETIKEQGEEKPTDEDEKDKLLRSKL